MNTKKFSEAMDQINNKYIDEALCYKAKKKNRWLKWGAIAACFMLLIFAGIKTIFQEEQTDPSKLPMLTLPSNINGGMSFEGYLAYDISDLVNENPWNVSAALITLPVFANPVSFDDKGQLIGGDRAEMEELLYSMFHRFGIEDGDVKIRDVPLPDYPTAITGEAEGIIISVTSYRSVNIEFSPTIELPDGYRFSDDASYNEILEVADYLKTLYSDFIGMEQPIVDICGGDYDFNLNQHYQIKFYEGTGSLEEQIVNYNMKSVGFSCDYAGALWLAGVEQTELPEKIGDYPIISAEAAKQQLLQGEYITNVPYELPGETYVAKVELVYRTGEFGEYCMPYYLFYVELPNEQYGELKTYGAYYVPAVVSAFISK